MDFENILDLEATLLQQCGQENLAVESLDASYFDNPSQAHPVHDPNEATSTAIENIDNEPSSGCKEFQSACSTFPTTTRQGTKRKRAAFEDPARRAKVAQVRKDSACMRCHIKKIPCATPRPCMSCLSCWVSLHARSSRLKWMGCVPYSWKDVNIYQLETPQSNFVDFSGARDALLAERTWLQFRKIVQWNIETLSRDLTEWLTMDEAHLQATSKVGMLSSVECQEVLQQNLSEHICTNLRLLVKTVSLLHSRRVMPHPHYSYEQITTMRQIVGAELLKGLEIALKNEALAQASRAQLLSLFIVLSGAIIAVRYTISVSSEDAGGMLLQILAHYLVLVGERVGLLVNDLTKMSLTEPSNVLWNKTIQFELEYMYEGMDSEKKSIIVFLWPDMFWYGANDTS